MFGRFGWAEILIIVVLVVVLFGSAKIPSMMRNLADGINVFKKELKDTQKKPVDKKTEAATGSEHVKKTPVTPVKKSAAKKSVATPKKKATAPAKTSGKKK